MQSAIIEKFVHPGEMLFGDRDTRICTTLGSCVAIVAWHPYLLMGGLSHYMMPGRRSKPREKLNGRYAEDAFELLIREFQPLGASLRECQIKLFGGGNMFPNINDLHAPLRIGHHNVEAAHRLMKRHGLAPVAMHLGGFGHRKLAFDVGSGRVLMEHKPVLTLAA